MVMDSTSGELNVCTQCIADATLSNWITDNGRDGKCDFESSHGPSTRVVTIEEFAEKVDADFREHYQLGDEEQYFDDDSDRPSYQQRGEPYREILRDELQCNEDVLEAIIDNLPDASGYDIKDGAELFYDDGANYESTAEVEKRERADEEERWYERRFSYQWDEFCRIVQYERRFFKIKELLDDLFGRPDEYEKGAIRPVYTLKVGQKIYRARLLDDNFTQERLLANPAKELGAPPREKARAGRMNVEYIPAFYAAFCEETAIAEIRPGIGDEIAVGEFVIQRELRVFDFTAFSKTRDEEWKDVYTHTRYEFITQMQQEFSRPILPFERQREYIATQIAAEYLKEYFDCGAIIYQSSMQKRDKSDNRNVVILNRGVDFVGTAATDVLSFSRHDIREVMNVTYEIGSWPF